MFIEAEQDLSIFKVISFMRWTARCDKKVKNFYILTKAFKILLLIISVIICKSHVDEIIYKYIYDNYSAEWICHLI